MKNYFLSGMKIDRHVVEKTDLVREKAKYFVTIKEQGVIARRTDCMLILLCKTKKLDQSISHIF